MRLIDADALLEKAGWVNLYQGGSAHVVFSRDVQNAPTVAPQEPNEPLTLEELREMDGEPVWVENPNGCGYKCERGWALVYVWSRATDQVYLLRAHDDTSYVGGFLLRGGKIYRRKPEEGTK